MTWLTGPMLAFDTETTGVEVERDDILSASLVTLRHGKPPMVATEYLNHGNPIPVGSIAIHGLTPEFIKENGKDPAETLDAVCQVLAVSFDEFPLVGMNCVFDLTILDRNCRRYGVQPLAERCEIKPVIDVFILDKVVDRYRKGSRKLSALADLYRVPLLDAHTAEADATAAARVAWRIGRLYPSIGTLDLATLHDYQVLWKRDQDASFAAYLKRQGKDATGLDGSWPWRPPPQQSEEVALW